MSPRKLLYEKLPMFGGSWKVYMNLYLIFLARFGGNEKKNIFLEVMLIYICWLQEVEIELKLRLKQKG